MKWYTIGSISFPVSWAAVAIAFLLSLLYLRAGGHKKETELWGNAIFYFIITWKFSFILINMGTAFSHPLSILYFNGGIKGYWLGLAVAFAYLVWKKKKVSVHLMSLVPAWIAAIAVYEVSFYLLNNMHIMMAGIQFAGGIGVLLALRKAQGQAGQIIVLFTFWELLLHSFAGTLLSVPVLTYVAGGSVMLLAIWNKRGEANE